MRGAQLERKREGRGGGGQEERKGCGAPASSQQRQPGCDESTRHPAQNSGALSPGNRAASLLPIRRGLSIPPTSLCAKAKSAFLLNFPRTLTSDWIPPPGSRTPAAEVGWGEGVTTRAQGPGASGSGPQLDRDSLRARVLGRASPTDWNFPETELGSAQSLSGVGGMKCGNMSVILLPHA